MSTKTKYRVLRAQTAIAQAAIMIAAEQVRAPVGAKDADGNSIGGRWVDKDQIYTVDTEFVEQFKKSDMNVGDVLRAVVEENGDFEAAYLNLKQQLDNEDRSALEKKVGGIKKAFRRGISDLKKAVGLGADGGGAGELLKATVGKAITSVEEKAEKTLTNARKEVGEVLTKDIPRLVEATVETLKDDPAAAILAVTCIGAASSIMGITIPAILASEVLSPTVAAIVVTEFGVIGGLSYAAAVVEIADIAKKIAKRVENKKNREKLWEKLKIDEAKKKIDELRKEITRELKEDW